MQNTSKIHNSIKNSKRQPAFVPFIVGGFPDLQCTKELIKMFEAQGAAAIEVGFAYSDPLADGPVIQAAAAHALQNGINIDKIFAMLEELKGEITIPVIAFTYFNPVFKYGVENFIKKAAQIGVSGLIIPDLPLEESDEAMLLCKKHAIDLIMLVSPASGRDRIASIAKMSSGFVYLVSSTGVTGVRQDFSGNIGGLLQEVKSATNIPVAVGFGVSKKEHVTSLKNLGVDAYIVGSAIVKIIQDNKDNKEFLLDNLIKYVKTMDISDD